MLVSLTSFTKRNSSNGLRGQETKIIREKIRWSLIFKIVEIFKYFQGSSIKYKIKKRVTYYLNDPMIVLKIGSRCSKWTQKSENCPILGYISFFWHLNIVQFLQISGSVSKSKGMSINYVTPGGGGLGVSDFLRAF